MKKILFSLTIALLFASVSAETEIDTSRYKQKVSFSVEGIVTPKVVKFETPIYLGGSSLLVNTKTNEVIEHQKTQKQKEESTSAVFKVSKTSPLFEGRVKDLSDDNLESFISFDTKENTKSLEIDFPGTKKISYIGFAIPESIIMPQDITVQIQTANGEWQTVLRNRKPKSDLYSRYYYVEWPPINAKAMKVEFQTPHLFRIAEVEFEEQKRVTSQWSIALFAAEGDRFDLYFDPSFGQKNFSASKRNPIVVDSATPVFTLPNAQKNTDYNPDFDSDGVDDLIDLCPKIADPENSDIDKNGRGDVCEDPDNDRIMSDKDNCDFEHNPKQLDTDLDGIGDVCDDEENRLTEINSDYLMYVLFGLGVLVLMFLVVRNRKN